MPPYSDWPVPSTFSICCSVRSTDAGAGVDEGGEPARGAVVLGAAGEHLVGEPRRRAGGVDDQPRGRHALPGDGAGDPARGERGGTGGGPADGRGHGQREVGGERLAAALPGALGALVHDDVAAEHRQPAVGAGQPHVPGAVGVDEHAGDREVLPGAGADRLRVVGGGRERGPGQAAVGGGRTREGVPVRAGGGADGTHRGAGGDGGGDHRGGCESCVPASVPGHGEEGLSVCVAERVEQRAGRRRRHSLTRTGTAEQRDGGQVCALQNPATPAPRDPQACRATACRAAARARVRSPAAS